jgi:hypothetical protein
METHRALDLTQPTVRLRYLSERLKLNELGFVPFAGLKLRMRVCILTTSTGANHNG